MAVCNEDCGADMLVNCRQMLSIRIRHFTRLAALAARSKLMLFSGLPCPAYE